MNKENKHTDQTEKDNRVYCSLDIETSGFDPLKNEILEVGFVFFVVENKGLRITEEWTRVFKPHGEVSPSILGLTGITQKELDQAPEFADYKQELQEKLGGVIIVGHNVIFDIKFLEAAGIRFSGVVIDTLDLVQFILPTHHSYNLENLMHFFSVSHENAHRALADSKACLTVLEKMLRVYHSFPKTLKKKIADISTQHAFSWTELLGSELTELELSEPVTNDFQQKSSDLVELQTDTVYNFPLGSNCIEDATAAILAQKEKVLLVVPKNAQVMNLWRKQAVRAVFSTEHLFDEKKLAKLEAKKTLTSEQAKFLLKILVWQATNWQIEVILDLNLSFFGGQFKSLISGKKVKEQKEPNIVCCDMQTFGLLSKQGLYKKRFVVSVGLSELEQYISSGMSMKLSWSYMLYILKSFYNPEIGSGNVKLKEIVLKGLAATDLFFGLVQAILKDSSTPFQYFTITPDVLYSQNFGRVQAAAGNYIAALRSLNKKLDSAEVVNFAVNLEKFFEQSENTVKWIELAETRCVFFSSPLEIAGLRQHLFAPYKRVALADSLGTEKILNYFTHRLGLKDFSVVAQSGIKKPAKATQGDLFQGLVALGQGAASLARGLTKLKKQKTISCYCVPSVISAEEVLSILKPEALPAAILFGGQLQIKQFYDQNYQQLQQYAFLLNQVTSGGSNKIFHNFSIHENSLLIGSSKLILKHLQNGSGLMPVERLNVKTLLLCNLPFEQFTHPYQEALSARFPNSFEDFSLPRAVYNFHSLLEFFYTDKLENIYLCDPKLSKGYANAFKDYVKLLPRVALVEKRII